MYNIVIFSGSARPDNKTQHVAAFVRRVTESYSQFKVLVFDPVSLGLKVEDETKGDRYPELKKAVAEADGYIIVSPEYNHSYAGSLKMMLDMNLKEYIHKPVALVGVSAGPWGGVRAIEAMVPMVRELGLVVTSTDLQVTNSYKEIENGTFVDPEKWERRAKRMLDELLWMTQALAGAREKIEG